MDDVKELLTRVIEVHKTGVATEHSYRPALEKFFQAFGKDIQVINEPKRVECGAPDFIVQVNGIAIGHVEAKDLGVDLRQLTGINKKQQDRYKKALPNLIYTNCLDWDFYRDGRLVASTSIGQFQSGIHSRQDNFEVLGNLVRDFVALRPQTITKPRDLAERMAAKALLIRDVLSKAIAHDRKNEDSPSALLEQYRAFQSHLIHDIELDEFADIYAETIAYGLFAARLHDTSMESFSRQEALGLLPKSNPFLRNLFGYIAGVELDERLAWIIDELADVFRAANVHKLMKGFGKLAGKNDPFLHFYETFLAAYNPKKRKARGVWYTPEPVVRFIMAAVDDSLRREFGLVDGLADSSKVEIDWDTGQRDKKGRPLTTRKNVHRVQILDPATGTGTFLAEALKRIAPVVKGGAPGAWSDYVESELIPRVHGFELLMAPYAMCHLKLEMVLKELGYMPTNSAPRLSVYLTNSLEEGEPANQTLPFAQWLTNEVKAANTIKRDLPIMCVVGNPPYNPSSKNTNPWIQNKMADYKEGLTDKKTNLNDDYMKFLRLGEFLIDRSGAGIVAMITNNSYLDGTTQRQMRRHLMRTFSDIDIYDLHGDIRSRQSNRSDENVFDITQGVAIAIMRKVPGREGTTVRYTSLVGRRQDKSAALEQYSDRQSELKELAPAEPYFFFVDRPVVSTKSREDFSLEDFFTAKSSGIQTKNDGVAISWTMEERDAIINDFLNLPEADLKKKYPPKKVWSTSEARKDILSGAFQRRSITYRPFDIRHTVLTKRSGGFLGRPRFDVMQHLEESDISLVVNKKFVGDSFSHVSVAKSLVVHGVHYLGNRGQDIVCPLYLKDVDGSKRPNFAPETLSKFQAIAAKGSSERQVDPLEVFDYIYGVLHCPLYRQNYADSLRNGMPRVPWPASAEEFFRISAAGTALRELHLLEAPGVGQARFPLVGSGDGVVGTFRWAEDGIWINDSQRFNDAPFSSWDCHYGGYQPAQKWLKDRVGRKLSYQDVRHYQRMLYALSETSALVQTLSGEFEDTV